MVPQPILSEITSHSIRLTWAANTDTAFSRYAILRSTSSGVGIKSNLSGLKRPVLRFWDRYGLGSGDWERLEVSTDGNGWTPLYGVSEVRTNRAEQSVDLPPGKNVTNLRIRFHLWSDGGGTEDGWSIDDFSVGEQVPVSVAYPYYEGLEGGLTNWLHAGWVADTNGA
jgi:hypothetical protein